MNLCDIETLFIYHRNCADGMSAVAVAATYNELVKSHPNAGYMPMDYHEVYEFVDTLKQYTRLRQIVLLDFSFTEEEYQRVARRKPELSILIMDHHPRSIGVAETPMMTNLSEQDKSGGEIALSNFSELYPQLYDHELVQKLYQIVPVIGARDRWQSATDKLVDHFKVHDLIFDQVVWHWPQASKPVSHEVIWPIVKSFVSTVNTAVQAVKDGDPEVETMLEQASQIKRDIIMSHLVTQGRIVTFRDPRSGNTLRALMVPGMRSMDSMLGSLAMKHYNVAFACMMRIMPVSGRDSQEFSLRSVDMDIRPIARFHRGDGHSHAAGFRTMHEPVTAIQMALAKMWLIPNWHEISFTTEMLTTPVVI